MTATQRPRTLRLYPPAWTIERDALADDDAAGTPVPAGSMVAISPYLVHRHPGFWPDPAGFDPRRFLPGGDGDAATRHRYAFIPFGGGRRACVGASFAELETVLVLAILTRRFRLELTERGMPAPKGPGDPAARPESAHAPAAPLMATHLSWRCPGRWPAPHAQTAPSDQRQDGADRHGARSPVSREPDHDSPQP